MKLVRNFFLTAVIFFVAILTGCVNYDPPPSVIHSNDYTGVKVNDQRTLPAADKVLTLSHAQGIALENNPDYKTYQLNKISAFALYYAALAAYSPTLSADWGATQYQGASSGNVNTTTTGGQFSASYQAFSGFTTTFNALNARATAKQSEWSIKNFRRQLVRDVWTSYNQVLYSRAIFRIQQANERFNIINTRNTALKYNAGASSLSELLNFKVRKNQAQSKRIAAQRDYKIARYALAAIMGLTTADLPVEIKFPEITVPQADEFELGVEFYLDIAIAQRPDLKAQKEALKGARYNLYSAWGAFSPTLDLDLNYGYSNANQPGGMNSHLDMSQNGVYNYGFEFNWDLWKGGSRIFNVRSQQALYDVQRQNLLKKWITIVKEVRTYYVKLIANVARRKVLDQARMMAKQRRDLVQEEFNAGNVDIATLNQAQNQLVEARQQYVQATIDVSNSRARLYAAVGIDQ